MSESEGYKILSLLASTRVETQTRYLLDMDQSSTTFFLMLLLIIAEKNSETG